MPRFTITSLLWLTALYATAMGTFGAAAGIPLASGVWGVHAIKWHRPILALAVILVALGLLIALLLPAVHTSRVSTRHSQSMYQLRMLVLALQNFHDMHGEFPPGHTSDELGNPLHSWRTLLLPYLEEDWIFKKLTLDESWDSPANAQVLRGRDLYWLHSPLSPQSLRFTEGTDYFAVIDERAVIRGDGGVTIRDITDGASNTIVLIEAAGQDVRWYEPRDLSMEEAIDLLTGAEDERREWVDSGFFVSTRHRGDGLAGRNVAFADGRVQSIGRVASREVAEALLTRAGGEEIPEEFDKWESRPDELVIGYIVHWRRVLSTALLVGLAIGPFFRRRAGKRVDAEDTEH